MRKVQFANGEYYHVYNRGVDHRSIVQSEADSGRFLDSLEQFNSVESIGGLKSHIALKEKKKKTPLVNIVAFCLNPNHFHLILEQVADNGISKFIKSLAGGYTKYFNLKYNRKGILFEGPFKVKHIDNNDYLLHLSCYVNLNNQLHKIGSPVSKLVRSSWHEYSNIHKNKKLCVPNIVLEQFKSVSDYKKFALDFLPDMLAKRGEYIELENLTFD